MALELAQKAELLLLSLEEIKELIVSLGEKRFRAQQIWEALHHQGVREIGEISTLSKEFRDKLSEVAQITSVRVESVREGADGTRKYQIRTHDNHIIESVLIPNAAREGRHTICISSQVGCAMGCTFCATAALNLTRHLTASEIASQIYQVNRDLREIGWQHTEICHPDEEPSESARLIHNIVYMGMGEPLHNYDNVLQSIRILTHPKGQNYSPRRITVSTSGVVKNIERLGTDTTVHIAISLNATTDPVRDIIMPVNRKWNIDALLSACRKFPLPVRRRITFEYVLLAGINDTDDDARRILELLQGMRCKVNLIPFNEHPLSPYKKPARDRVLKFQRILLDAHMTVFIRSTRGDDVDAACGMLGAKKLEEVRSFVQ